MISQNISRWLQAQWQKLSIWTLLLAPFSAFFWLVTTFRKQLYSKGLLASTKLPVPVITVGNISVGGTGKTPLTIWLAEALSQHGFKPGVISHGFGGNTSLTQEVLPESHANQVGDEPLLIKRRLNCPVFVGQNRVNAGLALLKQYPQTNIIISDDGLQHYALQRDVEIVVIDAARNLGNRFLLPAGPLRESAARLNTVNAVVVNGMLSNQLFQVATFQMHLTGQSLVNIRSEKIISAKDLVGQKIHAIAGIGNPSRFFNSLRALGLSFEQTAFADHHHFIASDFAHIQADYVLMTEKDAVKCKEFTENHWWYLPVIASVDTGLMKIVLNSCQKV